MRIKKLKTKMLSDFFDAFGKETNGVYESLEHRIIIKHKILSDESKFCGTIAHELCHYQHSFEDHTRAFENDLMNALGDMIDALLRTSAIPQESKQTKKKGVIEWLKKEILEKK